jgi:hypothetical protein
MLEPQRLLLRVVGRAVGDDDEARAGFLRLADRPWKPDVFADDEPAPQPVDVDDARLAAGLEVALFIEHRVVGQALLAVGSLDATVAQHGERVVAPAVGAFREADQHRGVGNRCRQHAEPARAGVDERGPQQQVSGG